MILDILYHMQSEHIDFPGFLYDQPVKFAFEHIEYILVCSREKNPIMYGKIKDQFLAGEKYTPPFMRRPKDYLFRDAYMEEQFYHLFVKDFQN